MQNKQLLLSPSVLYNNLVFNSSFDLLNHNFKNDSTFCKFKSYVFACRSDLAELGHCVQTLLWGDNHSPLATILLLQELDQHICRVIRKAFGTDSPNYVVLAEIFEVLCSIFGTFDPERVILSGFAFFWNFAVQKSQTLLHHYHVRNQLWRSSVVT